MSQFVFINYLQAKPGRQDELVELLRDFAVSMNEEPGAIHYSVHRENGDKEGRLTVIEAYTSPEAFDEHGAWMETQVPRVIPLLATPPDPPVLLEQVMLTGHARESFAA